MSLYIQGTAQQCVDCSVFDCHPWGHLKPLVYSAPTENEETLHQLIFNVCQTIHNRPVNFEMVRTFMMRLVLIHVDGVLYICCEL
jgi:hypothetical protein